MPVALLPPTTTGGGQWVGERALTAAPRYVRGRGNSRWHRVRSAVAYSADKIWNADRTIYHYWCGPSGTDGGKYGPLWLTDEPPADQPVCGTCVGRALGAGQDDTPAGLPPLVFSPRWQEPPSTCPGSRSRTLWTEMPGGRCGQCLACGDIVPIRVVGVGYNAWGAGPVNHQPGAELVKPCPFHAWHRVVVREGTAACDCGWPGDAA